MVNAEKNHEILINNPDFKLSYLADRDYETWRKEVKSKLYELLGLEKIERNSCPLNLKIESEEKKDGYTLTKLSYESEVGEVVPGYLLVPDTGKEKYPVAVILQGHSTGYHLSIGEAIFPRDAENLPRVAFALQAVRQGYATLAIEQRGLGCKRSALSYGADRAFKPRAQMCAVGAMNAITLGRTMLGERVWDIMRGIDLLESFPVCDTERIMISGNSGGATASFYAACFDERIGLSVPSCGFAPWRESILSIEHCVCNYIPGAYEYFDMQDLACLIAPRSLAIVAGVDDDLFPIDGVRRGYETVRAVYERSGRPEACRLVETPMGHWWCDDIVWETVAERAEMLGWNK